ncbi:putative DER1-like protein [Trypanosoma grayi]|uniref:putative DER1-like protein n=1 Tax=Trypanosoma grayi TaxID=71804 RepID=UPI0004F4A01A|nr:putative DER1-like protein [Trypanosoma grayi]KEG11628.1 putative DER1-like protein [Trypanosoma grayi]
MDIAFVAGMPPVTRVLMLLSAASVVLVSFGLIHPVQMIFSPTLVFQEKQYWRLLSTFLFFGHLDLRSVIELNWLHMVSCSIEMQYFQQRWLDYCFTLLTGMVLLLLLQSFRVIETLYLSFLFSKSLVYLFGRLLPNQELSIFGLVTVQVRMLPLLLLVVGIAFEGPSGIWLDLVANLVGHVLWYLLEIFPRITKVHPLRLQHHFMQ